MEKTNVPISSTSGNPCTFWGGTKSAAIGCLEGAVAGAAASPTNIPAGAGVGCVAGAAAATASHGVGCISPVKK